MGDVLANFDSFCKITKYTRLLHYIWDPLMSQQINIFPPSILHRASMLAVNSIALKAHITHVAKLAVLQCRVKFYKTKVK